MSKQIPSKEVQDILEKGLRRNEVLDAIPEASSRILDVGYGCGNLLMSLIFEKQCTNCYGIERNKVEALTPYLDENWDIDLTKENLPEKYLGYFDWVILHDVLEHIYNPWNFLGTLNKYMSDTGKIIIICPNAQYWETPYALLTGNWPLSSNGFWNPDHIRWFTFKTLSEVAIMSGFGIESAYLQYPQRIHEHARQFEEFLTTQHQHAIAMPLLNFPAMHMDDGLPFVSPTWNPDKNDSIKVIFPRQAGELFPYLMAIKIMLICKKRGEPTMFDLTASSLKHIRQSFYKKISQEELQKRCPKSIQTQIIKK